MSAELLSGFTNTSYQIDNLWSIFMGLHIIVFAGLRRYRTELHILEVVALLIAYSAFAAINGRALWFDYEILSSIQSDLINDPRSKDLALTKLLASQHYGDRFFVVPGLHVIAYFAVVVYTLAGKLPRGFLDDTSGKAQR